MVIFDLGILNNCLNMNKVLLINLIKPNRYILLYAIVLFCPKIYATTFYINDNSTKDDIYTTAVGNDINEGTTPDKPKLNIESTYKIAKEGDVIVIDIGKYKEISTNGKLLFENFKKIKFLVAGFSDEIYSKTPLPINEKVSPTIFYIKNDKPIDREAYLRNLKNEVDKRN